MRLITLLGPFLLVLPACDPATDGPEAAPPPEERAAAEESDPGAPPGPTPEGMAWIPGGSYQRGEERDLGTTSKYPEEKPAHTVTVDGFWMDLTEVTNRQFMEFAEATGFKTQAETGWSREEFPNAPEGQLKPGALVFTPPAGKVDMWQPGAEWSWWQFVEGASWRHPAGPESSIEDKMDHPAVCMTREDAAAYCKWAGKRLPTEAEWERAARGGVDHAIFVWGDEPAPDGKWQANIFHGDFPHNNTTLDGFAGTAPVGTFPANGYGLHDVAGNVWEICSDLYRPEYYTVYTRDPQPNPTGPTLAIDEPRMRRFQQTGQYPEMLDPPHPLSRLWVTKGGSYLCHHTYCLRYRPAARHYAESLTPTSHTGFRCVQDAE